MLGGDPARQGDRVGGLQTVNAHSFPQEYASKGWVSQILKLCRFSSKTAGRKWNLHDNSLVTYKRKAAPPSSWILLWTIFLGWKILFSPRVPRRTVFPCFAYLLLRAELGLRWAVLNSGSGGVNKGLVNVHVLTLGNDIGACSGDTLRKRNILLWSSSQKCTPEPNHEDRSDKAKLKDSLRSNKPVIFKKHQAQER